MCVVRVRETGTLPWAPFKSHLAMDTLALGLHLVVTYLCRGLTPYVKRHARRARRYPTILWPGILTSYPGSRSVGSERESDSPVPFRP